MQLKRSKQAFTLVELIVVITIVGILSTIGFVSYSGYLTGARDSNRISQMIKLSDSLQVYGSTKSLPLPDNSVTITASGTTIAYQGEVGVDVLETIDYTNGGADPKDDSYYSYMLTKDRNSMQLMAMMEEEGSTSLLPKLGESYAVNYEDRFPKVYGRKLGILTYDDDSNPDLKNTPLEKVSGTTELDVVLTTLSYTANISDETSDKISGTGSSLMAMNPKVSCKRIKQTGGASGNGTYTISPAGTDFQVYCNMEIAGGGWTMIARSVTGGTGSFGTGETGSINELNSAYQYGYTSQPIPHTTIMLATYSSGKIIVNNKVIENMGISYNLHTPHTIGQGGITGGTGGDGYNGEQGMIFVK